MTGERTKLIRSDRTDRETFYYLTMSADLTQILNMGQERTDQEFIEFVKQNGRTEAEAMAELDGARKGAYEAFYGRIRISLQGREHGGFAVEFSDNHTGKTLATEYTLENELAKARSQAVDRARELLATM
jgi:hypothetical protein